MRPRSSRYLPLSAPDRGMYFILRLTQLIVRPDSRLGVLRYKIAPKCLLPGPFGHSGVGGNPGVAGPVRSYNLVFTYPCQHSPPGDPRGSRRCCGSDAEDAPVVPVGLAHNVPLILKWSLDVLRPFRQPGPAHAPGVGDSLSEGRGRAPRDAPGSVRLVKNIRHSQAYPSLCSTLRTVLAEHSKSLAIRRRLAPPSRILRIVSTWWGLNFRGGPRTFPCSRARSSPSLVLRLMDWSSWSAT